MKHAVIFFLSVMVIAVTGCGASASRNVAEESNTEAVSSTENADGEDDEKEVKDGKLTSEDKDTEPSESDSTAKSDADISSNQNAKPSQGTGGGSNQDTASNAGGGSSQTTDADSNSSTDSDTPAGTGGGEPAVQAAAYDPNQVVRLAIARCEAGGMITTQENLANALAEGRITQEEYDAYYPYDGMEDSYYSVFVETDLNIAATVSGERLTSIEAIADHIAEMMLLETHPVFNIVYAGVYTLNGTDYYEFRCIR